MGKDARGPGTARGRPHGRHQGSTLIEAMLAVTLLGLTTLTALQASTLAAQRSRSAQQRAVAVQWSAELTERLQVDPATDLLTWQTQAAAALAELARPVNDAAVVRAVAATSATPAQWQAQLHWIDAADQRLAAHHAVIERTGLAP